jgi:CRISPR-associated endonuclease/helicase Cas3
MVATQPPGFWAKLGTCRDGEYDAWLPLVDHCADVAATCRELLSVTALGSRLARLGGVTCLAPGQVDRLSFLALLHDIGKFNLGFQRKALGPNTAGTAGHVREVLALFGAVGGSYGNRLRAALPTADLVQWGGGSDSAGQLLLAAICHHGRPYVVGGMAIPAIWSPGHPGDPFEGISGLVSKGQEWFPLAWSSGTPPLPGAPRFQHAFAGLVMLADWIGSDERFFPVTVAGSATRMPDSAGRARDAVRAIGLDSRMFRGALGQEPPGYCQVLPAGCAPRPAQEAVLDLPTQCSGGLAVLESTTGSGKTEAALLRYLRLLHSGAVDGMYFALPTRSAATQMYDRVLAAVRAVFPDEAARPPVVLAVPGYAAVDGVSAPGRLATAERLWTDEPADRAGARLWAAENAKRFLAGSVAVGTVDQVLLSALKVPHAHLRSTALLRQLLVVDEVHASDAYMTAVLELVLANHLAAGGHALLMSATLGSTAVQRIVRACGVKEPAVSLRGAGDRPYPLLSWFRATAEPQRTAIPAGDSAKSVAVGLRSWAGDEHAVAAAALDAAAAGAHVLVLRNTVRDCVATQISLESLAREKRRAMRFPRSRRDGPGCYSWRWPTVQVPPLARG